MSDESSRETTSSDITYQRKKSSGSSWRSRSSYNGPATKASDASHQRTKSSYGIRESKTSGATVRQAKSSYSASEGKVSTANVQEIKCSYGIVIFGSDESRPPSPGIEQEWEATSEPEVGRRADVAQEEDDAEAYVEPMRMNEAEQQREIADVPDNEGQPEAESPPISQQDLVRQDDDDDDVVYLETSRMDEEERRRRFGHVRIVRPYVPKPNRFFVSGTPTFIARKSNGGTRLRVSAAPPPPPQATTLNRPFDEEGVYVFRDDMEFVAASRRAPSTAERTRQPIYAGAAKSLKEVFGLSFLGQPSALIFSGQGQQQKKRRAKNGERRPRSKSIIGIGKKRKKARDDETPPANSPRSTPERRRFLFGS